MISMLSPRVEDLSAADSRMASGNAPLIAPSARAAGRLGALGATAFLSLTGGTLPGTWIADGAVVSRLPSVSGMHHLSVGSWPCDASGSDPSLPALGASTAPREAAEGGTTAGSFLFMTSHQMTKGQGCPRPSPCGSRSPRRTFREPHASARTRQWSSTPD